MRKEGFLIEHKHTEGKSFRLSLDMLHEIETKAFREGKKPAVLVRFGDEIFCVLRQEESPFAQ